MSPFKGALQHQLVKVTYNKITFALSYDVVTHYLFHKYQLILDIGDKTCAHAFTGHAGFLEFLELKITVLFNLPLLDR